MKSFGNFEKTKRFLSDRQADCASWILLDSDSVSVTERFVSDFREFYSAEIGLTGRCRFSEYEQNIPFSGITAVAETLISDAKFKDAPEIEAAWMTDIYRDTRVFSSDPVFHISEKLNLKCGGTPAGVSVIDFRQTADTFIKLVSALSHRKKITLLLFEDIHFADIFSFNLLSLMSGIKVNGNIIFLLTAETQSVNRVQAGLRVVPDRFLSISADASAYPESIPLTDVNQAVGRIMICAANLGISFKKDVLLAVAEHPASVVESILSEVSAVNIIERSGKDVYFFRRKKQYEFFLGETEGAPYRLHYLAAKYYTGLKKETLPCSDYFRTAFHFTAAGSEFTDMNEFKEAVSYIAEAARKAFAYGGYRTSFILYQAAAGMSGKYEECSVEICRKYCLRAADAHAMDGFFEESLNIYEAELLKVSDCCEQSEIRHSLVQMCIDNGHYAKALQHAEKGLSSFGRFPARKLSLPFIIRVLFSLRALLIFLMRKPSSRTVAEPGTVTADDFAYQITFSASQLGTIEKIIPAIFVVCGMTGIKPFAAASVTIYLFFASQLRLRGFNHLSRLFAEKAVQWNEFFKGSPLYYQNLHLYADILLPWFSPLQESIDLFIRSGKEAHRNGDRLFYTFSVLRRMEFMEISGGSLGDLISIYGYHREVMSLLPNGEAKNFLYLHRSVISEFSTERQDRDTEREMAVFNRNSQMWLLAGILLLKRAYLFEEFSTGEKIIEQIASVAEKYNEIIPYAEFLCFSLLTHAATGCPYKNELRKLKKTVSKSSDFFSVYYLLCRAVIVSIEKNKADTALFENAAEAASSCGNRLLEALSYRLCSRYLHHNDNRIEIYLSASRRSFSAWGGAAFLPRAPFSSLSIISGQEIGELLCSGSMSSVAAFVFSDNEKIIIHPLSEALSQSPENITGDAVSFCKETVAPLRSVNRDGIPFLLYPLDKNLAGGRMLLLERLKGQASFGEDETVFVRSLVPFLIIAAESIELRKKIFDETESRIRLEREKIQEQKDRSLHRMASGAAHDFKGFLSSISCYTERIASECSEKHLDSVEKIFRIIERAKQIARELSDYGSASVRIDSLCKEINLKGIIESVIEETKDEFSQEIVITCFEKSNNLTVFAEEGDIYRLFQNIMKNALEAVNGSDGEVKVTISSENNTGIVIFEDNGNGIFQEIMPFIFEPYMSTKKNTGGNGLGLAVALSLATKYGGSIFAANNTDRGCRFTVQLPVVIR